MTDERINIEIAELCGWKKDSQNGFQPTWKNPDGTRYAESLLPNYTADLNACHEFEQKFGHINEWFYYEKALAEITDGYIFHATARQRCEAFLRVHNQWEETK
jgi:hypothetical protein